MSVDNIETEKHLRRCERKNRGLPPNRYGWENQSSRSVVNSEQQITGNSQQAKVNEANFSNLHCGTSSRRSKASKISESSFKRRQLEADLAAEIEKAELEEQRDNLEIERKRIERQQFLAERRRELNQAILAEQLEENGRKTPDNISVNSLFQENIFENKSVRSEVDNLEKIEDWLHDQENHDSNVISIQNLSQAFAEAIKMGTAIATKNVDVKNDNDMKKFLARQSTAKDLPIFSGDPEDWTNFISQFNRSTEVCGFSPEENMYRLQKCLTGKARDAVQAMMISPEHTHEVIEVLKTNFGRPEYVIKSLIERAKHTAVIKEDKFEMIVEFSNVVRNLTITMEILKCTGHMNNPMLIEVLVGKLPPNLRLRWGEIVAANIQATTLKDFSEWLNVIAKAASCISTPALIEYKGHHQSRKGKETILATTNVSKQKKKLDKNSICLFCEKQDHDLSTCKLFQKEDASKRWKWAAEKKICFSCLKEGHQAYRCFKRKTCEKEGCTKKHHPLLHVDELSSAQTTSNSTEVVINTTQQVNLEKTVLLRIAPVTLRGPLGCMSTYALFDEASTVTLIDSDVADRLGMTGTTENRRIQPADGEESFNLTNVRTIKNLELPVQSIDMRKISAKWNHLKNISVRSMNHARPTILLGQDNIDLIIAREVIEGPKNAPVVSRTKLGWIVHGNILFRHRVDEEFLLHISHKENELYDDSLHQLVKDSFKLDMVGVKKATEEIRSKEDRRAIQILEDTSRRVGDRWETGILWKEDEISLGKFNSKAVAASRLHGIEKKMDKDSNFAQQYCEKIDEYIGKNYARKISTEEAASNDDRKVWYLPHFGVTNPNKPGKFRLVFDAAAKCRGTSINDVLLQGPDLLNSLMGILLRFRQRKIAFSADIKEMFHQILIRREDSMVQRFLWRGRDRTRAPDIMEMAVMIFGSVSSPYQAQEIKNRNAREFEEEYPEAAAAIIQRHYMDDYLDSTNTEEEAMKIISEVIQIHRKGGFQICNWISSSREVLRSIPKELRAIDKQDRNLDSELAIERVLGLHWNPNNDVFIFICKFNKIDKAILNDSRRPTKREVLRTVMSIFDPIGFLTCFTVKAKILLQDIWRSNIGWDDELSTGCWEKWHKWKRELMIIPSIHIPRCYSVEMIKARGIQLHMFCDASEKAYAAVAYLRIDIGDDIHTAFVTAKSRVAPLRPMSIPRLELQAAVLASRLSQAVVEELDIKIEKKFYWTDSQTVLYWLRSDARKYKTFVAHRIAEIGELTKVTEWNWVSTSHNVADEATRDGNGMNLSSESRWLNGPHFLKSEESKWFEDVSLCDDYSLPVDFVSVKRPYSALEPTIHFEPSAPPLATPSPSVEKVEFIEAYCDPKDSKSYTGPAEEAPGKAYTSPEREYSQPYTTDGSSELPTSDEEYHNVGPYPSAPTILDLNSPDSIGEDIFTQLQNKADSQNVQENIQNFSKRNPSPYYYSDLLRSKSEKKTLDKCSKSVKCNKTDSPKYRKSVSLETPGTEPEVLLPKRFSVTEDGLFYEVDAFDGDSYSSDESNCSECRIIENNTLMPPHRLLTHDLPNSVCACTGNIDDNDLNDEILFRPSRSVFYLPRTEDLNNLECCILSEDMTTRTRQIYETAFDCKISRSDDDLDEVDRVPNHPVLLQLHNNKVQSIRTTLRRNENKRPKPIPNRLIQQPPDNNSIAALAKELETVQIDKRDVPTTSQLPLRGYTPSPPSTAPLPTKFHGREQLMMNSIKSAPNLPSHLPRLKDLHLPVKSLRAREVPGSSESSIIEYKTRPRTVVCEEAVLSNRPRSLHQDNERILEIKSRPQRHSLALDLSKHDRSKKGASGIDLKGRNRRNRHKFSSTESMATSSSSMESIRSSTSEGNRSTSSSESRHSTSLSSHSSDSGSSNCFQGHPLLISTLTGFLPHHTNKLHILSPISDKSSQEPVSETSDNNRNNNSQKGSPEDVDNTEQPTTILEQNTRTKRRMPQNKNLLNLNFQPATGDSEILQGSDSGISIHSREGGKRNSAFQNFAALKMNSSLCGNGVNNTNSISSVAVDSLKINLNPELSDLPFDMPKLRRRRLVPVTDACTSGSATSVDLRDLPFDMPKLRRRLRGPAASLHPSVSTESSGVSQASSSQSVRDNERPSLGASMFRQKLTLNLGEEASPKKMGLVLGLGGCSGPRGLNLILGGANFGPSDLVDVSIPLERQGWYHGAITRVDAEGVLRSGGEGGFLVRNSESTRQDYSLSLKSVKGFMHMRIQRDGETGKYILGQFSKPFDSIPDMIRHFCVNRLPIRGAEHMCLLQPIVAQLL